MLIEAMLIHVCWVSFLYFVLTVLRAPVAWGLDFKSGAITSLRSYEPKVGANLSNQFEWPLVFYTSAVLAVSFSIEDVIFNTLAWCFIAGRIVHSAIHILTDNVRLRGAVFSINFVAAFLMWIRLYWLI